MIYCCLYKKKRERREEGSEWLVARLREGEGGGKRSWDDARTTRHILCLCGARAGARSPARALDGERRRLRLVLREAVVQRAAAVERARPGAVRVRVPVRLLREVGGGEALEEELVHRVARPLLLLRCRW